MDECHQFEETLLGLFAADIRRADCDAMGVFFSSNLERLIRDYISVSRRVRDDDDDDGPDQPEITVSSGIQRKRIHKTARALTHADLSDKVNPWHVGYTADSIEIRPLFARNLARLLLRRSERVLFMSATPGSPDHFFRNLGITEDTDFVEVKSDFPAGRGIFLPAGLGPISRNNLNQNLPTLAHGCAVVMREMPHEKGLILCAGYDLQRELYRRLQPEFGHRLLNPESVRVRPWLQDTSTPKSQPY